ncbi:MAG: hypothetical protein KDC66_21915 [Phaeodactylibacter sp.]|nr:hypothetical protein [Phaeodactylibacter sp.]
MYGLRPQLRQLQRKVDDAYLYYHFAKLADDEAVAQQFRQYSAIRRSQAESLLLSLKKMYSPPPKMPPPSWRAWLLVRIARLLGYRLAHWLSRIRPPEE